MSIIFFCKNCGARFEVAPNLAGKNGRCNRCSSRFSIPESSEEAPPAAAAKAPAKVPQPKMAVAAASPSSWAAAMNSNVGLKPLTMDNIPINRLSRPKPVEDDNWDDTDPYKMAEPVRQVSRGRASKPVGAVKMVWRKELGGLGKALRWINETAYLISVPFLGCILIGAMMRNRPLALLGATVVVLLNVGRLGVGIVNLAVNAFKEGIGQGIFFLIPPLTFVYLNKNWKKVRKPTKRVIEPAITIALVFLAFTFIPSLSKGGKATGTIGERVKRGAQALEKDIGDELTKAKALKPESVTESAKRGLKQLEGKVNDLSEGRAK